LPEPSTLFRCGLIPPHAARELSMKRLPILATVFAAAFASHAFAADAEAGKATFKSLCSTCHSAVAGKNVVGPSLFGIVGRKSGQIEGFHYSAANKSANLTWDEATLDKYLTNPKGVVPGTTMTFAGVRDDTKRADLIAYLATVH
jgi:cytochrome c